MPTPPTQTGNGSANVTSIKAATAAANSVSAVGAPTAVVTPNAWYSPREAHTDSLGTIKAVQGNRTLNSRDLSGNGHDLTQSTAANQPRISRSLLGGQPAWEFASASTMTATGAFTGIGSAGYAVAFSFQLVRDGINRLAASWADAYIMYQPGVQGIKVHTFSPATEAICRIDTNTAPYQESLGHCLAYWDGVNLYININGVESSVACVGTPQTSGDLTVGNALSTSAWNGLIGDVKVISGAQVNTYAKRVAVMQEMQAIVPCCPPAFVVEGTSIERGSSPMVDPNQSYGRQAFDKLGLSNPSTLYCQFGHPGEQASQIQADTVAPAYLSPIRPLSFLILEPITNTIDQNTGITAQQCLTAFQSCLAVMLANNPNVPWLARTVIARSSSNPAFEATKNAYNVLLKATYPNNVADTGGAAGFQVTDIAGGNYLDQIHPSPQGASRLAEIVNEARDKIIGNYLPAIPTPVATTQSTSLAIAGASFESFPRYIAATNATAFVSGTPLLAAIDVKSPMRVTSISFLSGLTAASVPTHWFFALYDANGGLIGQTADQLTTAWGASTLMTLPLASQVDIPAGLYYAMVAMVATLVPTLEAVVDTTALSGLPPILNGTTSDTVSTGTAPNPFATVTATVNYAYAALS